MSVRYYSTQRPVGPGTYPKEQRVLEVINFDRRTFCEEIGRPAWGYIEYEAEISQKGAENYELVKYTTQQ